jgi:hypothetical protein
VLRFVLGPKIRLEFNKAHVSWRTIERFLKGTNPEDVFVLRFEFTSGGVYGEKKELIVIDTSEELRGTMSLRDFVDLEDF